MENWRQVTQDQWVLETIWGYRIPFVSEPRKLQLPRQLCLSNEGKALLEVEIQEMLEKGAIQEARTKGRGFVSNVFLVPKKEGGQRPVINLKKLNEYIHTEHFKMEVIHLLKDLLRKGDWMTKVDLKDAYFMVPIRAEDRDFLKFVCRDRCYMFNCLPFGLACAPWVFTKILKPVAAQLRELGVRMIVYIDDMLIIAETPELLRDHTAGLIYQLENLGFIISYKKCVLEPTQSIDFLGFMVDSTRQELRLPAEKIKKIRAEARKLSASISITARKLSQFLGKLNAATRAVPVAPLFYRSLQASLGRALTSGAQDYSVSMEVTPNMREELQWWEDHLSQWNGRTLVTEKPAVVIETDASKRGWGATSQGVRTGGPWSRSESNMHINCLEALAAFLAIKCFARNRRSVTILLRMDNMSAVTYVNKLGGTVSQNLTAITKSLWLWCLQKDISFIAEHLPGVQNAIADEESRVMKDRTDWKLNPEVFKRINRQLGPLAVDLFASRLTTQQWLDGSDQ